MSSRKKLTLRQKQSAFAYQISELIQEADAQGFEVTLGHAFRSPEEAKRLGFKKSLHTLKLAIDLNLFKDGKYLSSTESHRSLGVWWEDQSTSDYECCWGGRFGDGNHYSISHWGRK